MSHTPRTFADIEAHYGDGVRRERVRRLAPGTPLYVNEEAILRDFGWLLRQTGDDAPPGERCRTFLARVGSVLGAPHEAAPAVNCTPNFTDDSVSCLRPPRYGRAGVLDVREVYPDAIRSPDDLALVDVKGLGVAEDRTPAPSNRKTGLLTMIDALQELINAEILDSVFRSESVAVRCNEIYGVVDLGVRGQSHYFDGFVPCVTLLRRAHLRAPDNEELPRYGSPEDDAKCAIETMLRRYGVTSAPAQCALHVAEDADGELVATLDGRDLLDRVPPEMLRHHFATCGLQLPQTIRFINIQTASDLSADPLSGTVIDLGHYTVLQAFDDHHLVAAVQDRPFNWGRLFRCGTEDWIDPDPQRCADPGLLGKSSFASDTLNALTLSALMMRSQEKGTIPGSMREAARLTAAWLATGSPAEPGAAAVRFARAAMRRGAGAGPGERTA